MENLTRKQFAKPPSDSLETLQTESVAPERLSSRASLVHELLTSQRDRDAYVYEHVRNGIPFQIRALRKQQDWSQLELAKAANTSRTVITRIEDPNYGSLTLKTLYQIASAFGVALLVKFVPFSRLLREYEDVSFEALAAKSIDDPIEIVALRVWADAEPAVESSTTINTTIFTNATEGAEIVGEPLAQRKDCVLSIPSRRTELEQIAA